MLLIEKRDANFNYLFDKVVFEENPEILNYDFIVAGGFPIFCWQLSNLMDFKPFKMKVVTALSKRKAHYNNIINEMFKLDYGDIDFWLLDNNLKDEHKFLLEDNPKVNPLDLYINGKNCPKYSLGGSQLMTYKSTKWANTFRQHLYSINNTIQIIKKHPKDVPDLFKDFDFENSKFAFYNGKLIYSKEAAEAFDRQELVLSNPRVFINNSLAGKVYACLRAFKYAKRHLLEFDKQLSSLVFNIMIEACTMQENDYEDYMNNCYMKTKCDSDTFFSMVDALMNNLLLFSEMKNYEKHWSAFFLDNPKSKSLFDKGNVNQIF